MTAKAIDYLEKAKARPRMCPLARRPSGGSRYRNPGPENSCIGKTARTPRGPIWMGKKSNSQATRGKSYSSTYGHLVWAVPAMIPHERELVKKLDGKPFVLLSVSADDDKATLTSFIEKEPMPWSHWWAGPKARS